MFRAILLTLIFCVGSTTSVLAGNAFTIFDAVKEAVKTNPGVGEAAANRRATEAELHQTQGTLLPQVRLEATAGPEKLRRYITPEPTNNGSWMRGREMSVVVRQKLFDGLTSIYDIWRQAARVDAASYRVHERTALIALDAAEAYIDVVRYTRLVTLAQQNVHNHQRVFTNVRARFSGGRAGEGDLQQAEERRSAAEATLAEFRQNLETARAKYLKVVGLQPYNLRFPGRLPGLPTTRDQSLAVALHYNPTIRAAGADVAAAKYGFRATAGSFVPQVSLEGRATRGADSITYEGRYDEVSGKVVLSWDLYTGGQDSWKRKEASERMIEQTMKEARLQRDAFESLDKAWAARTVTSTRIAALVRDVASARKVVAAYSKEYQIGQRSLIDLLTAENQYFNASVSLVSARGVAVFADYQLLAVMGKLLDYTKAPHPVDARPLDIDSLHMVPLKLPPVILKEPTLGPAPLKFLPNSMTPERRSELGPKAQQTRVAKFNDRWRSLKSHDLFAAVTRLWSINPGKTAPAEKTAVAFESRWRGDQQQWSEASALSYAPTASALLNWPIKSMAAR